MSIEEYADLASSGYSAGGGEQTAPEDEFFHSVYISGKRRKNHIGVEEQIGKIQIRGVQYNLDEVHMIITHVKDILANIKTENKKDTIQCFSYKDTNPWQGTSKIADGSNRTCPSTSAERAVHDFCAPCKTQILMAGIYCKPDGTPILSEDKKPYFIFIRGKGMRFSNVSNYLSELYKDDLPPLFEPVTEQSKEFEKSVVNNKRFVTKLKVDYEETRFGNDASVFVLERSMQLANESVMSILKLSKQTLSKFNEKFDWSKGKFTSKTQPAPGILTVDEPSTPSTSTSTSQESSTPAPEEKAPEQSQKTFSFDDIKF